LGGGRVVFAHKNWGKLKVRKKFAQKEGEAHI